MQPETEFVSPPPFPNAPVPDDAALRALQDVEQEMQRSPCPLPEAPVSDFPAPMMTVMYSPHRLALAGAREAVAAALAQAGPQLPRGARPERAAETLRPVFVPRWFLKGEIGGSWSANGVETESWEVDCPNCFGSGKIGTGANQRECQSCWGSGKEKQTRKAKHPEHGEAGAALLDSLDNNGTGVALAFEALHEGEPLLLPDAERARLRCLRPASIYSSNALDGLKNRLAAAMEEQAKSALKKYSRIDGFLFDGESVRSHSAVGAWLYPAYLGSFEAPGAKCYVLCDALGGKVVWTHGAADDGAAAASSGGTAAKLPLIAGAAAIALAAGAAAWYFLKR